MTDRTPTRSPEQIREDMKELWPAIPIAAVVLAWFLQPSMAFTSADGMAGIGFLMAVAIVGTRMMIIQKEPKAGMFAAVCIVVVVGLGILVFSTAGEADKRNQRQCAHLERMMFAPSAEGRHALEVYGALKCRPAGVVSSMAGRS